MEKIDSLKKALSSLHDTLRIHCLNEISNEYILAEKKDSALYFSNLANEEAQKINYIHGIAVSFLLRSQMAKHFDDDFIQSEIWVKESLQWYEKTGNKEGIDILYNSLWYTVFAQSRFDEAIVYVEKQYAIAKQNDNLQGMLDALQGMYATYRQSGDYEKSFLLARQKDSLALKTKNKQGISNGLYSMAQLYELIEDYHEALAYFRKVLEMDDAEIVNNRVQGDYDIWFRMEFTEAFSHLHQFDSAWHYYNLFKPAKDKAVYMRVWWVSTGECYYLQQDYRHALQNFQLGLAEHKKLNDRNEVMRTLLDIGKTYQMLMDQVQHKTTGFTKIAVRTADGFELIPVDQLIRCEADDNYTHLYLKSKKKIIACRTLKEMEEQLQDFSFLVRVHHSYLVNLNDVKKYVRGEGGYLIMSDDSTVNVSRSRKDALMKWF